MSVHKSYLGTSTSKAEFSKLNFEEKRTRELFKESTILIVYIPSSQLLQLSFPSINTLLLIEKCTVVADCEEEEHTNSKNKKTKRIIFIWIINNEIMRV